MKKGGYRVKYAKMFSFLFGLFETLGINAYPNLLLKRKTTWDDIYYCLQKTPYGKFSWCPSKECKGGLVALNKRLKHEWQIKDRLADRQYRTQGPSSNIRPRSYFPPAQQRHILTIVNAGQNFLSFQISALS